MSLICGHPFLNIAFDDNKSISKIYVEVGASVSVGDKLFEYSLDTMEMTLEQYKLDLDRITDSISTKQSQITLLEKERDKVSDDVKLEYTMQILQLQIDIKQEEYNKKTKEIDIDRLKESITNSVVTSTMGGVVKAINEAPGYDNMGQREPFMSIVAVGDYRIKGKVTEQTVYSLYVGQPVVIRSRLDENKLYTGRIDKIDTENPESNSGYYYGPSSGDTSSKYPFYITLDNSADLLMGQHVFIELDYEQNSQPDGLYIDEFFIQEDDKGSFCWAEGKNSRLEKRYVTLGAYDDMLMKYEILDGLTAEDYIAWPDETCATGIRAVRFTNSNVYGGGSNTGNNVVTGGGSGGGGVIIERMVG